MLSCGSTSVKWAVRRNWTANVFHTKTSQEYERKRSMIGRSRRCFCLVLKVHKYFQKNSEGFFLQSAEWGNEAMEMYITGTLTELNDEWQSYGGKRQARISGDDGYVDPPVPIPNTVVKHIYAESTWLETAWEDRKLPVKTHLTGKICYGVFSQVKKI